MIVTDWRESEADALFLSHINTDRFGSKAIMGFTPSSIYISTCSFS